MAGKMSSATEFSTNTVPSAMAISSSLACVMGPTAAIALPRKSQSHGNEECWHAWTLAQSAQPHADNQREADPQQGIDKALRPACTT